LLRRFGLRWRLDRFGWRYEFHDDGWLLRILVLNLNDAEDQEQQHQAMQRDCDGSSDT
jgi:hypothetical protein